MGNFLDDLFKKVFNTEAKQPVNFKENFTVKEGDFKEVEVWQNSEEAEKLFALVYKNYHFKRTNIQEHPQVHVFSSPYANGFAVSYEAPFDPKSFSLLFLALSRRILDLGYRQVSLDRKFEEINEQVRLTEKFYFKPPIQDISEGELISQLFGNIALEKISIDNQPSYIKLLATVYSDRLYHDADTFDNLMDRLFETL
ncbi:hypothetical protein DFQ04_2882 [Algoriphagus boseongensis]|uniref:Uncharacterized protein n=1 Tax=Algoriphagus boseongensis TaxID=1442587 RepID=A0A4R6T2N6_9BACT|nr:hypothetical protein [Algoriphagus boseongensis]TDQ14998.1 hypothetical protein DFQ04_2882 [Algoriphagus boseongensis]